MRLTQKQISAIHGITSRWTGDSADIYLFGSRLNEQARGGDIDLLIETDEPLMLLDRARIKIDLEKKLGLPVDIISQCRHEAPTPFQKIARLQAVRLDMPQ